MEEDLFHSIAVLVEVVVVVGGWLLTDRSDSSRGNNLCHFLVMKKNDIIP